MIPGSDPHEHARLVRDFVPALARQQGANLLFDVADPEELPHLIIEKLAEVVDELRTAPSPEILERRLATVHELVLMIAKQHGMDDEALNRLAQDLDALKGNFSRGFVLREEG